MSTQKCSPWRWVCLLAGGVLLSELSACNPYDERLPAAKCETPGHCLPGFVCRAGVCEGPKDIALSAIGHDLHVRVTATLDDGESRLVAERTFSRGPEDGVVVLDDLPGLRLSVLAWQGDIDPCPGARYADVPVPNVQHARLRLALYREWEAECTEAPPWLDWSDHAISTGTAR